MAEIITIENTEYIVPKTWNDLEKKALLTCYDLIIRRPAGVFAPVEHMTYRRIEAAKFLLGLSKEYLHEWETIRVGEYGKTDGHAAFIDELDQIARQATGFMFDELPDQDEQGDKQYQVALTLTKNHWPEITHDDYVLIGPDDGFENLTIYELGTIFMLLERYTRTGEEDYADELLATLYRPPKPKTEENEVSGYKGDRRLPLYDHESTIGARVQHIQKLPHLVRQVMLFWVASCRQSILNEWPDIFAATEGEREGNDYAWGGLLLDLAGGVVQLEKVANTNYKNVFMYLSKLESERKERVMKEAWSRARKGK
jgi:hypothetical protein